MRRAAVRQGTEWRSAWKHCRTFLLLACVATAKVSDATLNIHSHAGGLRCKITTTTTTTATLCKQCHTLFSCRSLVSYGDSTSSSRALVWPTLGLPSESQQKTSRSVLQYNDLCYIHRLLSSVAGYFPLCVLCVLRFQLPAPRRQPSTVAQSCGLCGQALVWCGLDGLSTHGSTVNLVLPALTSIGSMSTLGTQTGSC